MRHVRSVTVARADAVSDFMNAVWRAWQDFILEMGLTFLGSFNLTTLTEKQ